MEGFGGYFLFVMFICVTPAFTQRCPRGCTCHDVITDSVNGPVVNCSSLHLEVLPRISSNAVALDFKENRLDRIPNNIKQLTELRMLNLSKNLIYYQVPTDIFSSNTKLKILDLSENHLSVFSENALVGLNQLEKLDLHNNLFTSLPDDIFQPLPLTAVVCMGHNHWRCDCELHYTVHWFLSQDGGTWTNICDGGVPACSKPQSIYGRMFPEINMRDVPPCEGGYPTTEITTTEDVYTTSQPTTTEIETSALITSVEKTARENKEIFTKPVDFIIKPSLGFVGNDERFQFNNDLILPIAIVLIGLLFVIIFLAFSMLLCKLTTKERSNEINLHRERSRDSSGSESPWPLLQNRRLPALLPSPVTATSPLTEYEEIPFDQREYPPRCESNGYVFSQTAVPLRSKTSSQESDLNLKGAYASQIDPTDDVFDSNAETIGTENCQAISATEVSNSQLRGNYASPVSSGRKALPLPSVETLDTPIEMQYTPMKGWVYNAKSITDLYEPVKEET